MDDFNLAIPPENLFSTDKIVICCYFFPQQDNILWAWSFTEAVKIFRFLPIPFTRRAESIAGNMKYI